MTHYCTDSAVIADEFPAITFRALWCANQACSAELSRVIRAGCATDVTDLKSREIRPKFHTKLVNI